MSTKVLAVALEMLPPVLVRRRFRQPADCSTSPVVLRGEGSLVPAAVRAGCRVRPRQRRHPGRARRRWLGRVGPEGVDVGSRKRRPRPPRGPDRSRRARPAWHLLLRPLDAPAGCRGAAPAPDVGWLPLQRGLPRRRLRARRRPDRRSRRRLDGAPHDARQRVAAIGGGTSARFGATGGAGPGARPQRRRRDPPARRLGRGALDLVQARAASSPVPAAGSVAKLLDRSMPASPRRRGSRCWVRRGRSPTDRWGRRGSSASCSRPASGSAGGPTRSSATTSPSRVSAFRVNLARRGR